MKIPEIDTAAAAATLRALGNETRLQIALRLLRGEASVGDLERELGLRQPNLSQQLGELRDAGLVVGRRESKSVIYSLANASQERLMTALAYGFGGLGPQPLPLPSSDPAGTRRAHLGAVFARVTTHE
jgi:DNA-binding transcriptional ArsR family regulator